MSFSLKNTPIRRELTVIILLTSVVVMVLMRGTFFTYDFLRLRSTTVRQLTVLGHIIAANSTAALAFDNADDAREILAALGTEEHISAAALYDRNGRLFAQYPDHLPAGALPVSPGAAGYAFDGAQLAGFQSVVQGDNKQLGTLYLRFETGAIMSAWVGVSLGLGLIVMTVVLLIAFALSRVLQRQISQPIVALAATAQAVSKDRDYSVRTIKQGDDEVGLLTDSFNQMLSQIGEFNQDLEKRVAERTAQLAAAHEALRREQERLRFIFDTMPMGLSFTTRQPDGTLTRLLNDAHLRICGLTREQIQSQDDLRRISHPDDYERQLALVRDLEAGRITSFTIDKRYLRPDGQVIWVFLTAQRRQLDNGICEDLSVVVDITERKRAEDALLQANQQLELQAAQLEATNKELESFSYSVSHDLRAPLRHVDGFASLLQHHATTLDEKGRRYLTTISGAAKQMGRLIDDLLNFSRMGRTALQSVEIDLTALVTAIIRDSGFEKSSPALTWKVAPLPRVRADHTLLRQVWVNLLENAVKYSSKASQPCIEIGSHPDPDTCEQVFFIRDNGAGFDMRYVDKLFGVFQRLHGPAEFEGTGIGLANVRRIITRHGGRTWAEGVVGTGATFYFSLPATLLTT